MYKKRRFRTTHATVIFIHLHRFLFTGVSPTVSNCSFFWFLFFAISVSQKVFNFRTNRTITTWRRAGPIGRSCPQPLPTTTSMTSEVTTAPTMRTNQKRKYRTGRKVRIDVEVMLCSAAFKLFCACDD